MHLSFAADSKQDDASVAILQSSTPKPKPADPKRISYVQALATAPVMAQQVRSKLEKVATSSSQLEMLAEMNQAIANDNVEALDQLLRTVWMTDEVKDMLIAALPQAARRGSWEMVEFLMPYLIPFLSDMSIELVDSFVAAAEINKRDMIYYMLDRVPKTARSDYVRNAAIAAARNGDFSTTWTLCYFSKLDSTDRQLIFNTLLEMEIDAGNVEMALKMAHLGNSNNEIAVDDIPDFTKNQSIYDVIAFLEEANRFNCIRIRALVPKVLQSAIKHNHLDLIDRLLNMRFPNFDLSYDWMIQEIAVAALVVGSEQLVWKAFDRLASKKHFVLDLLRYSGYLGRVNVIREIVEVRYPEMAKYWDHMLLICSAASKGNWDVIRYNMKKDYNINWNDKESLELALGYAVRDGQFDIVKYLHEKLHAYESFAEAFHPVYLESVRFAKTTKVFGILDGILELLYTNEFERQELIFETLQTALRLEEPEHATWAINRLSAASIKDRFNDETAKKLLNPKNMQATIHVIYKSTNNLQLASEFVQAVRSYWDHETGVFKPPTLMSMQELFLIAPWQAMPTSTAQSFARTMLDSPWYRQIANLDGFMMPNLMHLGLGTIQYLVETKWE